MLNRALALSSLAYASAIFGDAGPSSWEGAPLTGRSTDASSTSTNYTPRLLSLSYIDVLIATDPFRTPACLSPALLAYFSHENSSCRPAVDKAASL
jgi:hypothetical protein